MLQFEDRPWFFADTPLQRVREMVEQHAVLGDGYFAICRVDSDATPTATPTATTSTTTTTPAGLQPLDRQRKGAGALVILVTRDSEVVEDDVMLLPGGAVSLDGAIAFADIGELVAFYQVWRKGEGGEKGVWRDKDEDRDRDRDGENTLTRTRARALSLSCTPARTARTLLTEWEMHTR